MQKVTGKTHLCHEHEFAARKVQLLDRITKNPLREPGGVCLRLGVKSESESSATIPERTARWLCRTSGFRARICSGEEVSHHKTHAEAERYSRGLNELKTLFLAEDKGHKARVAEHRHPEYKPRDLQAGLPEGYWRASMRIPDMTVEAASWVGAPYCIGIATEITERGGRREEGCSDECCLLCPSSTTFYSPNTARRFATLARPLSSPASLDASNAPLLTEPTNSRTAQRAPEQ